MGEITFHGLDIGIVQQGDDLVELLLETTTDEYPLKDGDILVMTSKVVSVDEGRQVELSEVEVDDRDRRVARETGLDEREVAMIYEESDVIGAIPISDIGGDYMKDHAEDNESARDAIEKMPSALVTERNGRLCSNAGVDLSNSPEGMMTLLPEDPDASARRVRKALEDQTGKSVAVVLADSEIVGPGTMDLAVGCSGIQSIDNNFGQNDLFDQPKIGGMDCIADELAAGSALLFGQADERTPAVVVRGLEYERSEGTPKTSGLFRTALKKTIPLTLRVKLRELI